VNVIVCETNDTTNVRVTLGAGLNTGPPAWFAVILHVPAASNVIAVPLIPPALHTPSVVDTNTTGDFDDAFAATLNDAFFIVRSTNEPNAMLWLRP
jgi:hypothetical protein